jgi:hypothetical protein
MSEIACLVGHASSSGKSAGRILSAVHRRSGTIKGGTASGACVPGAVRQPNVEAIAVSTRDQSQPWACTKQAYPSVGVFLLATGGKVLAVIAIERSDITVGVGPVENCALAVRQ